MAVSEKNVSDALTYLADDPHPLAIAQFELAKAEAATKNAYARAFLESKEATVDARKADAECHDDHVRARAKEAEAILECERHKRRVRAAESLLDIWRTENANARAAERIR